MIANTRPNTIQITSFLREKKIIFFSYKKMVHWPHTLDNVYGSEPTSSQRKSNISNGTEADWSAIFKFTYTIPNRFTYMILQLPWNKITKTRRLNKKIKKNKQHFPFSIFPISNNNPKAEKLKLHVIQCKMNFLTLTFCKTTNGMCNL